MDDTVIILYFPLQPNLNMGLFYSDIFDSDMDYYNNSNITYVTVRQQPQWQHINIDQIIQPPNHVFFHGILERQPYSNRINAICSAFVKLFQQQQQNGQIQNSTQILTFNLIFQDQLQMNRNQYLITNIAIISNNLKRLTNNQIIAVSSLKPLINQNGTCFFEFMVVLQQALPFKIIYLDSKQQQQLTSESIKGFIQQIKQQFIETQIFYQCQYNAQAFTNAQITYLVYNTLFMAAEPRYRVILESFNPSTQQFNIVRFKIAQQLSPDQFLSQQLRSVITFIQPFVQYPAEQQQQQQTVNLAQFNIFPTHLNYVQTMYNLFYNTNLEQYVVCFKYQQLTPYLTVNTALVSYIPKQTTNFDGNSQVNSDYAKYYDWMQKYRTILEQNNVEDECDKIVPPELVTNSYDELEQESRLVEDPITRGELVVPDQQQYQNNNVNRIEDTTQASILRKRRRVKKYVVHNQNEDRVVAATLAINIPQNVVDLFKDTIINEVMYEDNISKKVMKFKMADHDFEFVKSYIMGTDQTATTNKNFLVQQIQEQICQYCDVMFNGNGDKLLFIVKRK